METKKVCLFLEPTLLRSFFQSTILININNMFLNEKNRTNEERIYLPGQIFLVLQGSLSWGSPRAEQSLPPYSGTGLVQFLIRDLTPPAHDLEHNVQGDQGP